MFRQSPLFRARQKKPKPVVANFCLICFCTDTDGGITSRPYKPYCCRGKPGLAIKLKSICNSVVLEIDARAGSTPFRNNAEVNDIYFDLTIPRRPLKFGLRNWTFKAVSRAGPSFVTRYPKQVSFSGALSSVSILGTDFKSVRSFVNLMFLIKNLWSYQNQSFNFAKVSHVQWWCWLIGWPSSLRNSVEWALSVSNHAECWFRMGCQLVQFLSLWELLLWLYLLQSYPVVPDWWDLFSGVENFLRRSHSTFQFEFFASETPPLLLPSQVVWSQDNCRTKLLCWSWHLLL